MENKVDEQAISRSEEVIGLLLQQFIRCSEDRPFDRQNPFAASLCEGCTFERDLIMNLVKSYRTAFQLENAISEITEEIGLLLQQFIRCSEDKPFDKQNPFEDSSCERCTEERDIITGLLESYRTAF